MQKRFGVKGLSIGFLTVCGFASAQTYVQTSPAASQTIAQPAGTSLNVSGNVGIGTASPEETLDVFGIIAAAPISNGTGTSGWFMEGRTTADEHVNDVNAVGLGISIDNGGANAYSLTFGVNPPWPAEQITERMRITSAGNVGIGTTSPANPLTIARDNSSAVPSQFMIQGLTNGNQQLVIGYNTTSDFAAIQSIKEGTAAEPLLLNPFAGAIGVGLGENVMPTFGAELEVNGTIKIDGNGALTFRDGTSISSASFLGTGGGVAGTPISATSLPSNIVYTDTPQTITGQKSFSSAVGIGIATAAPAGLLDVGGGNPGGLTVTGANLGPGAGYSLTPFQNSGKLVTGWNLSGGGGEVDLISNRWTGGIGGFNFYDYTNSGVLNQLVTMTGSGNVGIGTTTPGATLEVNGNIKLTAGTGASITFPDGTVQSTAFGPSNCSTAGPQLGPITAPPSGSSCSTNGAWVFSQDGHATFCANGTWTMKI